jgi:hypothetical protein
MFVFHLLTEGTDDCCTVGDTYKIQSQPASMVLWNGSLHHKTRCIIDNMQVIEGE